MINLNEVEVKGKNPVFNDGEAGEAVGKVSVEKKTTTDKSPDWNLFITDEDGRALKEGFYYKNREAYASDEKFNNALKYEAAKLKHIINALYGEIEFPLFQTPKEMLDGCMNMIAKKTGTTVKVGVNYGTIQRPKNFLQLKSTFPFITSNLEEPIKPAKNDLMERPEPSAPKESTPDSMKMPWDD